MCLCADIFFKTTDCLRADKSTCYKPGDQHYQITHSGLDAQVCAKKGGASVRQAGRTSDSVYVLCIHDLRCRFSGTWMKRQRLQTCPTISRGSALGRLGFFQGAGASRKMCLCMFESCQVLAAVQPSTHGLWCVYVHKHALLCRLAPVSCMCRVAANVHYGFVFKVTAKDTYEGLQAASELFVAGTLEK